jgi:hypothetical protein
MYNRTHYNRQSYNRKSRSEFEWTGTATAESRASGSLLIERHLAGNVAEAVAEAFGEIIRRHLFEGFAEAASEAAGALVRVRFFSGTAVAEANASGAGVATYGQEVMTILGVNMVPGDELVIDTEHMTVTLNGENIIDRVSDDAVFFKLMSGINDITVEGGTTADVRIVWKDRWL